MNSDIAAQIESAVIHASTLYHRLVFLVGQDSDEQSDVLLTVAGKHDWPIKNLGLALSQQLLDVPRRHRAAALPRVLAGLFEGVEGQVLCLDHIEVLFTPELKQDPVRLLQGLSRNQTLVVSWPGARDGTTLMYAERDHPEYYKQPVVGLVHVEISGSELATQAQ